MRSITSASRWTGAGSAPRSRKPPRMPATVRSRPAVVARDQRRDVVLLRWLTVFTRPPDRPGSRARVRDV